MEQKNNKLGIVILVLAVVALICLKESNNRDRDDFIRRTNAETRRLGGVAAWMQGNNAAQNIWNDAMRMGTDLNNRRQVSAAHQYATSTLTQSQAYKDSDVE